MAVQLLDEGQYGLMMAVQDGNYTTVPGDTCIKGKRRVDVAALYDTHGRSRAHRSTSAASPSSCTEEIEREAPQGRAAGRLSLANMAFAYAEVGRRADPSREQFIVGMCRRLSRNRVEARFDCRMRPNAHPARMRDSDLDAFAEFFGDFEVMRIVRRGRQARNDFWRTMASARRVVASPTARLSAASV